MSMEHLELRALLDPYVDGELAGAELAALEGHLAQCARCGVEVGELRALRTAAGELPREMEPPRDLWRGIAARIQQPHGAAGQGTEVQFRRPPRRLAPPWWLGRAAAAVGLVVLSAGVTTLVLRAGPEAPLAVTPPAPEVARPATGLAAFASTETEYQSAVRALETELEARRGQLSPQTVATIEENLRIIDAAIAETRAVLEADPGNADVPLMLSTVYRKKVELLERAVTLPSTRT
jgi:anti-sigma factor RsiW